MASNSDNTTSTGNTTKSGTRPVLLMWMMPKAFFSWPGRTQVTRRKVIDAKIQTALRATAGPGFSFERHGVVNLLVDALETLAVAFACNDPSLTDKHLVMANTIALAQAQVPWLDALSMEHIMALCNAMVDARQRYLEGTTAEEQGREEARLEGSNAFRLASAVDDFDVAKDKAEKTAEGSHMAAVAGVMSLVDTGFGQDLSASDMTPVTVANRPARPPPTADEQRRMDNAWAVAWADEYDDDEFDDYDEERDEEGDLDEMDVD